MSRKDDLLLSYYGDDFTGSTDVMEALTVAGVRTVLFLEAPSRERLQRFEGVRAVGVAGMSRSLPTEEMEAALRPAFEGLKRLGAPIVHYKVCSTFDSSPEVGSIGRAIDVGCSIFRAGGSGRFVPLVVGAPALGRYCVFGNLFARSGLESEPYRLDRHPTMSRHPVTPMTESDLRVHLSKQTGKGIGLFDVFKLEQGASDEAMKRLTNEEADEHGRDARATGCDSALWRLVAGGAEVVLFDTLHERHLEPVGGMVWREAERSAKSGTALFAAGSSGLEYALTAHWRAAGVIGKEATERRKGADPATARDRDGATKGRGAVEQVVVVSGSCSPVTARQIEWALGHGFEEIALAPERLVDPETSATACEEAVKAAVEMIEQGKSVILHTARGPDDERIARMKGEATKRRSDEAMKKLWGGAGDALGEALGTILVEVLRRTGLQRAGVTGGDTSGHVARRMGIEALEMAGPMAPGSPLCRVHARDSQLDGVEIIFKGGQVGKVDLFGTVLRGRP